MTKNDVYSLILIKNGLPYLVKLRVYLRHLYIFLHMILLFHQVTV